MLLSVFLHTVLRSQLFILVLFRVCNAHRLCLYQKHVARFHLLLFPALCLPLLLPLPQLFRVMMAVLMAPLRCCSFNCRGWNSGKFTLTKFINSLDLCFIQEHWLFYDHLSDVCEISPEIISVGVSGMNSDLLSRGRPYGGCSIPYRKSLSSCISPVY